jgi:nicotinamidase-related amidase
MENLQNLKSNKTALLIIDVQNFYWNTETHEEYIANLKNIIEDARKRGLFVVYVIHVWGDNPKDKIFDIREEIRPLSEEPIVVKHTPGSFYDTNLQELLVSRKIENVIITGMKTNHCCDTTTREASARGYKTFVINEGVRTFDLEGIDGKMIPRETIQYVTLSILKGFAQCITTEEYMNIKFE